MRVISARITAARAITHEVILLYWDIGQSIVEKQQFHSWGDSVVEMVALDLRAAFPGMRGFSPDSVWRMRQLYSEYAAPSFLEQLVPEKKKRGSLFLEQPVPEMAGKLVALRHDQFLEQLVQEILPAVPWGHHVELLKKVKSPPRPPLVSPRHRPLRLSKSKKSSIDVQGSAIAVVSNDTGDYISLTDMAKKFGDDVLIYNWMRNRNTLEFIGIWEQIHNPTFKGLEFETFRNQAGLNRFSLTPRKWIEATGAIGFQSKAGRYGGGTYAHKDIAFEFGSWLSPEFKLYLIKEFQRLKDEENDRLKLDWNLQRTLAKINYRIHTDAIKDTLIPPSITKAQATAVYASEADLLNVALFGQTAKQWRDANPGAEGNLRDHAPLEQLVVLTNLESLNSVLIRQGLSQPERLASLNHIAITQMQTLLNASSTKRLK